MSVAIGASLQDLAGRDAGRGHDVDELRAHYATLGVDVDELAVACVHYLIGRRGGDTTAAMVSLAGRMFEIGYRAGRETGDVAALVRAARDVIDHSLGFSEAAVLIGRLELSQLRGALEQPFPRPAP